MIGLLMTVKYFKIDHGYFFEHYLSFTLMCKYGAIIYALCIDGSGYIEDGREIFDDEEDDNIFTNKRTSNGKKKLKQPPKVSKSGLGNIKNMLENMPTKKRKVEVRNCSL